ncbi:hypothetical protein [Acinetobacter calcoaceticus]|uniref:hypothetical protein n=1 Tax=Acinetobacter calcoaceticus TaxID=471 RepID=UPI003AF4F777
MNSYLPQWLVDSGTILGIVGFFITIWLLWEAKQIRNSFMRKARLPEVIKDLSRSSAKLVTHLKNWETEEKEAINQLIISKALIENLIPKVPDFEKKRCKLFVNSVTPRTLFFWTIGSSTVDEDKAWSLYTLLIEVLTMLEQLNKDSKWD